MAGELTFGSSLSGFGNPSNSISNFAIPQINPLENINDNFLSQLAGLGNNTGGISPALSDSNLFEGLNFDKLFKAGNFGLGLANTLLGFGTHGAVKRNNKFNQDLANIQLLSNARLTQEKLDTRNKARNLRDITNNTNFGREQPTDILSGIQKFTAANG